MVGDLYKYHGNSDNEGINSVWTVTLKKFILLLRVH